MKRRSNGKLSGGWIGAVLVFAVVHQTAAALSPGLHGRLYSAMAGTSEQQTVDRSSKGDSMRRQMQISTRGEKPAATQTEPSLLSPRPATRPQIPLGCETAVSSLALRTSVVARCLS